jgi:hypothetical protein
MKREFSNQDAESLGTGAATGAAAIDGDEKTVPPPFRSIAESEKEEAVSHHSRGDEDEGGTAADGHEEDEVSVAPTISRASLTRSLALSIVPRSRRRGWFGRFAVIPEVDTPYDYSSKTKWTITSVVALAGAVAPMGSAIFYRMEPPFCYENSKGSTNKHGRSCSRSSRP